MNALLLISLSVLYLALLFFVAQWAERKHILRNKGLGAWIYALSIAVYCSAWTFYGSIGRAATTGLGFLAIYLGPALVFPLWWVVARKIIRIVKVQHISSLADFLSARYGRKQSIGTLVSLLTLFVITPYLALQIKAIGDSFSAITPEGTSSWLDPVLVTSGVLCLFTLVYGIRFLSTNEPKNGMVTAVALESVIKLLAFLLGGAVLVYGVFGGMDAIFSEAVARPDLQQLFVFNGNSQEDWFWILLISGFAIFLLPRQFQVGIIENQDEAHLKRAMWLVPLYLFLINIFVLPIAMAGRLHLPEGLDADYIFLSLSNTFGNNWLTGIIYFGGFSAATSMIIVSSLSLANMLSTNVIFPAFLRLDKQRDYSGKIVAIRILSLVLVFISAYVYYRYLTSNETLVSIGITSFAGIAQLAPAFFGGLYWRGATRKGAIAGISIGFVIWFYALILPNMLLELPAFQQFLSLGPWGIKSLSPLYFGDFTGITHLSAVIGVSLVSNTFLFAAVSVFTEADRAEANQAEIFVNIFRISRRDYDQTGTWQSSVPLTDIRSLLINFLGDRRTEEVLDRYARINGVNFAENQQADPRMISYAERLLTEAIGPASARITIARVAKGEEISVYEVMDILQESKEVLQLNRELRGKTEELERASLQLREANDRLKAYTEIKDEFLYTVTHELRTPLTAIRAQAELLQDDEEMPAEDRQMFLDSMVKECERLTNLITHVLDLEKFESGSQKLHLTKEDLREIITEAAASLRRLVDQKGIRLKTEMNSALPASYMDRDRMFQVMVNLISNAIKYCNPEQGEITITAYVLNNDIKVNVIDNGAGISEQDASRIFDKFYQIKNQTRKKPTGSGLGLAICKNIIQMHQGRIWVQPEPPVGTRFSFTIPTRRYLNLQNDTP